jgi:hypothetical protein
MSDSLLFVLIFGGLFVFRIILATIFFGLILPADDRCPNCDAPTLRIASAFDRFVPWFRRRWCIRCGWKGVLRRGAVITESARTETLTRR